MADQSDASTKPAAATGARRHTAKTTDTPPAVEDNAVQTATGPVVPAGKVAAPEKGNIFIELQRTLHGWGQMFEVLEVDPSNEEVQGLLANEHALKVARKDLVPDPSVVTVEEPTV